MGTFNALNRNGIININTSSQTKSIHISVELDFLPMFLLGRGESDLLGHYVSHIACKQTWITFLLFGGNINRQEFKLAVGAELRHRQPKQLQSMNTREINRTNFHIFNYSSNIMGKQMIKTERKREKTYAPGPCQVHDSVSNRFG